MGERCDISLLALEGVAEAVDCSNARLVRCRCADTTSCLELSVHQARLRDVACLRLAGHRSVRARAVASDRSVRSAARVLWLRRAGGGDHAGFGAFKVDRVHAGGEHRNALGASETHGREPFLAGVVLARFGSGPLLLGIIVAVCILAEYDGAL